MSRVRQHYGAKAPTKQALATALLSVLHHRKGGKPVAPWEIRSWATSYGRSEQQVVAMAREAGCEVGA